MAGGIDALTTNPGPCDVYKPVLSLKRPFPFDLGLAVTEDYTGVTVAGAHGSSADSSTDQYLYDITGPVATLFSGKAKHTTSDANYMEAYFTVSVHTAAMLTPLAFAMSTDRQLASIGEATVVSSCSRGSLTAAELGIVSPGTILSSQTMPTASPLLPFQTYTLIIAAQRSVVSSLQSLHLRLNASYFNSTPTYDPPAPLRVRMPSAYFCDQLTPPRPPPPSPFEKFLATTFLGPLTGFHILIISGGGLVLLVSSITACCCWRRAVRRRKLLETSQAAAQRAMQNRGKRNTMRGSVLDGPLPAVPDPAKPTPATSEAKAAETDKDQGELQLNPLNASQGGTDKDTRKEQPRHGDGSGTKEGDGKGWHVNNMRKIEVPPVEIVPAAPPVKCPNCGVELTEATAHRDRVEELEAEVQHLKAMLSRWGNVMKGGRVAAMAGQASRIAKGRKEAAAMEPQGTTGDYEFVPQPRGLRRKTGWGTDAGVSTMRMQPGSSAAVPGRMPTPGSGNNTSVRAVLANRNAGPLNSSTGRMTLGSAPPATAIPVAPFAPADAVIQPSAGSPRPPSQPSSRALTAARSSADASGSESHRRLVSSPSARAGWQQASSRAVGSPVAASTTRTSQRELLSAASTRALSNSSSSREVALDGVQGSSRGPSASQRALAARSPSRRLVEGDEGAAHGLNADPLGSVGPLGQQSSRRLLTTGSSSTSTYASLRRIGSSRTDMGSSVAAQ